MGSDFLVALKVISNWLLWVAGSIFENELRSHALLKIIKKYIVRNVCSLLNLVNLLTFIFLLAELNPAGTNGKGDEVKWGETRSSEIKLIEVKYVWTLSQMRNKLKMRKRWRLNGNGRECGSETLSPERGHLSNPCWDSPLPFTHSFLPWWPRSLTAHEDRQGLLDSILASDSCDVTGYKQVMSGLNNSTPSLAIFMIFFLCVPALDGQHMLLDSFCGSHSCRVSGP